MNYIIDHERDPWNIGDLVEIWILSKGPAIGVITNKFTPFLPRQVGGKFDYAVIADGELHIRRRDEIFDVGESRELFRQLPQTLIKWRLL